MTKRKYEKKNQSQKKQGRPAYIPNWYPGVEAQVRLIEDRCIADNIPALRLITVGSLIRKARAYVDAPSKRSIPIPHYIWDALGGKSAWQGLLKEGMIEDVIPHERPWMDRYGNCREGKCREFVVATHWLFEYAMAGLWGLIEGQPVVNIFTGHEVRPPKTCSKDTAKNYLLRPGYQAHEVLRAFGDPKFIRTGTLRCPVDVVALVGLAEECILAAKTFPEDQRLRSYAISLSHLLITLSYQGLRPDDDFVEGGYSHQPAYDVLSSGRIMQQHGGLQMTPCVVRWAALESIPGILNVDMVGAQAAALHRLCSIINSRLGWLASEDRISYAEKDSLRISTAFTEKWAKNSKLVRHDIAKETGLDVDIVKTLTFVLVFGGSWKKAVFETLCDHFQDEETARDTQTLLGKNKHVQDLRKVTRQLSKAIGFMFERPDLWRKVSVGSEGTPAFALVKNQHGVTVTNAVGATLSIIDGIDGTAKLRGNGERVSDRHVAAHLAQGLEQEYMGHFRMGVITDERAHGIGLRYCLDAFDGGVLWYDRSKANEEEALRVVTRLSEIAQKASHISTASSILPKEIIEKKKYEKFRGDLRRAVQVAESLPAKPGEKSVQPLLPEAKWRMRLAQNENDRVQAIL